VNGADTETGITIIAVDGIDTNNDMVNVFGCIDWVESV